MPTQGTVDDEVRLLLMACRNRFGSIGESTGGAVVVAAVQEFVRMPSERSWDRARRFFVSWEGERFTLGRAVAVFSDVSSGVPSADDVMHALRVVSS